MYPKICKSLAQHVFEILMRKKKCVNNQIVSFAKCVMERGAIFDDFHSMLLSAIKGETIEDQELTQFTPEQKALILDAKGLKT